MWFGPAKTKQTCKSIMVCKGIPHSSADLDAVFTLSLASSEQLIPNLQAKQKYNKCTQNLFPFFKVPKYISQLFYLKYTHARARILN